MKRLLIGLGTALLLTACGGGTSTPSTGSSPDKNTTDNNTTTNNPPPTKEIPFVVCPEQNGTGSLTILGKIEYERIQPQHSGGATILDTSNITNESAKDIIVTAVDASGATIASTCTDGSGNYALKEIPESTSLKVRAYAKMKNSTWDVKVVDNTHSDALYLIEGSLRDSGTTDSSRDLKASYANDQSAPFAILDSVHQAMDKVLTANSSATFPALKLNWSLNNISSSTFKPKIGQIVTTLYSNSNIYVLGDKSDTDEFDNHVIIHEWGHYFEDMFSRADSIGGSHSAGQKLDIRLAFGEGFGNAFSAIVTDDPLYYDTLQNGTQGSNMNIESATPYVPGYFSEASIQRILYDLYDSNNDGADSLSMGFTPLYNTLVGAEKTTPAFTSIFTFITALKNENADSSAKIDAITSAENISDISDIYGTNNNAFLYAYLRVGDSIRISTNTSNGVPNKLENHKYIRFSINRRKSYRIRVDSLSSNSPDPDFELFKTSSFIKVGQGYNSGTSEVKDITLDEGEYLLDIYDANFKSRVDFSVTIN